MTCSRVKSSCQMHCRKQVHVSSWRAGTAAGIVLQALWTAPGCVLMHVHVVRAHLRRCLAHLNEVALQIIHCLFQNLLWILCLRHCSATNVAQVTPNEDLRARNNLGLKEKSRRSSMQQNHTCARAAPKTRRSPAALMYDLKTRLTRPKMLASTMTEPRAAREVLADGMSTFLPARQRCKATVNPSPQA